MARKIRSLVRRLADWALHTQRYRYLRAHLWDDAVHEMRCGNC